MKLHFVLDENILILAEQGKNERGVADPTCLALIPAINLQCHSLVMSNPIWGKYAAQLQSLQQRRAGMNRQVLPLLRSHFASIEKNWQVLSDDQLQLVPETEGVRGIDHGDLDFVRAAASVKGTTLVTTDGPLREALAQLRVDQAYGFATLDPSSALETALRET